MNEKLVHPEWEFQISLDDGKSTLVVIEEPVTFRRYVVELMNQCNGHDGDYVLSDSNDILSIKDRMVFVTDPLNLNPANKKVSTKITQQIKELVVSESHYVQTLELIGKIEQFASSIENDYKLCVCHSPYTPEDICKMLNIQLQVYYDNELERVMEFMNVFHDVCSVDCFAFTSMLNLFNENELDVLINEATANKHNLIFFETNEPFRNLNNTKKLIIDSDFCQIF